MAGLVLEDMVPVNMESAYIPVYTFLSYILS